ncbi:MAG: hypothetical protein FD153_827 [Rhodospirillaceae bacterium]|nr:MAG: hypothetical protein FD153_827 [Rhodospirillaceae bacterium]
MLPPSGRPWVLQRSRETPSAWMVSQFSHLRSSSAPTTHSFFDRIVFSSRSSRSRSILFSSTRFCDCNDRCGSLCHQLIPMATARSTDATRRRDMMVIRSISTSETEISPAMTTPLPRNPFKNVGESGGFHRMFHVARSASLFPPSGPRSPVTCPSRLFAFLWEHRHLAGLNTPTGNR